MRTGPARFSFTELTSAAIEYRQHIRDAIRETGLGAVLIRAVHRRNCGVLRRRKGIHRARIRGQPLRIAPRAGLDAEGSCALGNEDLAAIRLCGEWVTFIEPCQAGVLLRTLTRLPRALEPSRTWGRIEGRETRRRRGSVGLLPGGCTSNQEKASETNTKHEGGRDSHHRKPPRGR